MNAAATTSAPTPTPGPARAAAAAPSVPAALASVLGVLHWIIQYGMDLMDTIERRAATDPQFWLFARTSFRTTDLELIIARLLRGLRLAEALQKRLQRWAARGKDLVIPWCRDPNPSRRRPRDQKPGETTGKAPRKRIELPLDPTDAEIEAWLHRHPPGAVLNDICRDIGVLPGYLPKELRKALNEALIIYGTGLPWFLKNDELMQRARAYLAHPELEHPGFEPFDLSSEPAPALASPAMADPATREAAPQSAFTAAPPVFASPLHAAAVSTGPP